MKEKTLVDVSCPAIVKEYNKYMGSVDLARMLRALYRIDHRSRKWYRIFWTPRGSSERFTLDVAETLTKVNKAYARKSCGSVSVAANIETSRSRVRRPEPRIAARFDQSAMCQMQHSSLFDTTKKLLPAVSSSSTTIPFANAYFPIWYNGLTLLISSSEDKFWLSEKCRNLFSRWNLFLLIVLDAASTVRSGSTVKWYLASAKQWYPESSSKPKKLRLSFVDSRSGSNSRSDRLYLATVPCVALLGALFITHDKGSSTFISNAQFGLTHSRAEEPWSVQGKQSQVDAQTLL
ncbi:hypothetical protein T02_6876 [Trichinella nativa]|uniref:PiggyBac transposable element-derived protein domain-containing protein n=1 Tax=Trichinella nativa TaxID=6335 RepID=A0A0V1KU49_9BILA|nr:hypothetical protein T02_6876 [Trichinella nativa]